MNTIVRCYIQNQKRLNTLEREIISWKEKGMNDLGELFILDDISPMQEELKSLASKYKLEYRLADPPSDTKNGLYWSLRWNTELGNQFPVLCTVDDIVFGQGAKERVRKILTEEIPVIGDEYATIGLFACYENPTRSLHAIAGTDLWSVPIPILYALTAHLFSERISKILIQNWEDVLAQRVPYPACCDDIWMTRICLEKGIKCYNTNLDYVQHTGMDNRTFGDSGGSSNYTSKMFVGE